MFDFDEIYVVSDTSAEYLSALQIAFGSKFDDESKTLQYLTANDVSLGHTIVASDVTQEGASIRVVDANRTLNSGAPVVWEFVPLDADSWSSLANTVVGHAEISAACPTVFAVKEYYRQHWLDQDWWTR